MTVALALDPTYRNRSAGSGVDKIGKMLVDFGKSLADAWAQSVLAGTFTGWRRHGSGDGLSVLSTTLDANIWTGGSSGDGYKSNGTAWSAGDGANSWSNVRAWQRWVYWDEGAATTLEMMAQRFAATGAGNETGVNWGVTTTGFSGTPTANSPYPTGSYQTLGQNLGTASAWNGSTGLNFNSLLATAPAIGSTQTYAWQVWRDVGGRGWALAFYDASAGDRGPCAFMFELAESAAADPYPFVCGGGTWANVFGGDGTYTGVSNLISTSAIVNVYCYNGGAWFTPRQEVMTNPAGSTQPPGATAQPSQDLDGNYSLVPLSINLDNYPSGTTWTRKGIVRDCYTVIPGTTAHIFPQRVEPTNTGGKQWILMGAIALPWESGVTPTWSSAPAATETTWRIWPEPGSSETTPPTIGAVTPGAGAITNTQSLAFTVSDADSGVATVTITADYSAPDVHEVIAYGAPDALAVDSDYSVVVTGGPAAYSFTVSRVSGWKGPFTLRRAATDKAGNNAAPSATAYTISTSPNPSAPDTTAPVIGSFSPVAGAIAYNQAVSFPVSDDKSSFRYVVTVQMAGQPDEVAWDGYAASSDYSAGSSFPSSGTVTVARTAGWPEGFTLSVNAYDAAGNWRSSTTAAYTISTSPNPAAPDTSAPTVALVTPTSLASLGQFQPVVLEFDDDRGIEYFSVFAIFPSASIYDLVIDGADLGLETNYEVSYSTVSGRQRAEILRRGGWPIGADGSAVSGYLRARAIDARGNQT